MGSIMDYTECPNCGHEAHNDFYYKTGEEYTSCNNCGYHVSVTIKNRDKRLDELTEDDWQVVEITNPYGAYRIKGYNSAAFQCGSLEDESQFNELKQSLIENNEIEFFMISRLIDGEIVTKVIIDNGPKVDSAGFTEDDR